MGRILVASFGVAALLLLAACASETALTSGQAYAPVERLDLAGEAVAKERRARQSQANVQSMVDKMAAERANAAAAARQ